jgi:hypothetical protein
MKLFVITVMLIALYLLYRIAFPKQAETKKGNDIPVKREMDTDNVVGQSRFVRGKRRQPTPTPATCEKPEHREEKPDIFAAGNGKTDAAIPPEELDKVFGETPVPMDIDYPLERVTEEEPDEEEEAEELRQTVGKDAEPAGGFTYEEMEAAINTVNQPSNKGDEAAARVLSGLNGTDMFEQLILSDAGKALRIKAVIERHEQSVLPEELQENKNNNEYSNFDITDFC